MSYQQDEERTYRWRSNEVLDSYVKLHEVNMARGGRVTVKWAGQKMDMSWEHIPDLIDLLSAAYSSAKNHR
jgi:hypothetical protein